MEGGAVWQDWLQCARGSFIDEFRFAVEKATVATSGMLLRVVKSIDVRQVSRRSIVKASFPEMAGVIRETILVA